MKRTYSALYIHRFMYRCTLLLYTTSLYDWNLPTTLRQPGLSLVNETSSTFRHCPPNMELNCSMLTAAFQRERAMGKNYKIWEMDSSIDSNRLMCPHLLFSHIHSKHLLVRDKAFLMKSLSLELP